MLVSSSFCCLFGVFCSCLFGFGRFRVRWGPRGPTSPNPSCFWCLCVLFFCYSLVLFFLFLLHSCLCCCCWSVFGAVFWGVGVGVGLSLFVFVCFGLLCCLCCLCWRFCFLLFFFLVFWGLLLVYSWCLLEWFCVLFLFCAFWCVLLFSAYCLFVFVSFCLFSKHYFPCHSSDFGTILFQSYLLIQFLVLACCFCFFAFCFKIFLCCFCFLFCFEREDMTFILFASCFLVLLCLRFFGCCFVVFVFGTYQNNLSSENEILKNKEAKQQKHLDQYLH